MDGAWRRPTDSRLRSGTPSPSEVPSGGARAFCLLLRFSKVSRRQGGTLSGRYRRNGYVLGITASTARPPSRASPHNLIAGRQLDRYELAGRHRRQASSHSWIVGCQIDMGRLAGRHRRQASSHIWIAGRQVDMRWPPGRHGSKLPQRTAPSSGQIAIPAQQGFQAMLSDVVERLELLDFRQ